MTDWRSRPTTPCQPFLPVRLSARTSPANAVTRRDAGETVDAGLGQGPERRIGQGGFTVAGIAVAGRHRDCGPGSPGDRRADLEDAPGAVAAEHGDGLAAIEVRRLAFEDIAEIGGFSVIVHGSDLLCRGGPGSRRPHHRIVVKVLGGAGAGAGQHMASHLGLRARLEGQQLAPNRVGREALGEHVGGALGHAGQRAELGDEPGLGRALMSAISATTPTG